jgi:hypothetical protein
METTGVGMTAARAAKMAGFKTLKELSALSRIPVRTLQHIYQHDRSRFDAIINGGPAIRVEYPVNINNTGIIYGGGGGGYYILDAARPNKTGEL